MHIRVTDVLSCARCGPLHGLVLMAEGVEDRRVREGVLGCPTCGSRYAVRGGLADLRVVDEGVEGSGVAGVGGVESVEGSVEDAAVSLAALMGLREGVNTALVVGVDERRAVALASLVPGLEVLVVGSGVEDWGERAGVSRVLAGRMLPMRTGVLGGVALTGAVPEWLEGEGVRVLGVGGRLVLEGAVTGVVKRLRAAGLTVLVQEGGVVVAERPWR